MMLSRLYFAFDELFSVQLQGVIQLNHGVDFLGGVVPNLEPHQVDDQYLRRQVNIVRLCVSGFLLALASFEIVDGLWL